MQGLFWRSEKMKRGNTIIVLILLIFVVGCGQSKQVKVTDKSDPPLWVSYKQNGDFRVNTVEEVGSFVHIEGCNEKKIELVQVDCGDIGKNTQGDWPCYKGCERIRIRANCEVKLGLKKEKNGYILNKWEAYFDGNHIVTANSGWNEIEICVVAWKAKLYEKNTPGIPGKIGELIITVQPRV
jgi:hypothetical protein